MHGLGELNTYFMMPNEQVLLHWNYQKWHQKLHLDDLRSHKAVFQETLRLFQQLTWGNDITTSVGTTSLEACLSGNAAAGWWLLGCIPCLWSLRRWWCHPQLHCPGPCWCQPRSLQLDGPQLVRHMGFHMLQRFLATSGYNINKGHVGHDNHKLQNYASFESCSLGTKSQAIWFYDVTMCICNNQPLWSALFTGCFLRDNVQLLHHCCTIVGDGCATTFFNQLVHTTRSQGGLDDAHNLVDDTGWHGGLHDRWWTKVWTAWQALMLLMIWPFPCEASVPSWEVSEVPQDFKK